VLNEWDISNPERWEIIGGTNPPNEFFRALIRLAIHRVDLREKSKEKEHPRKTLDTSHTAE
jgi:hypothetical protein